MSKKDVVDFLNSVAQVKNDLSEPLDIYRTLEKKYINASNKEYLDALHKEKKVIFSYLHNFENASIKEVRAYLKEIKNSVDLDEIKSFNSPKNIDFVKIAYKQGKWAFETDGLKETIETKDVPTAIEYLTQIVARFDPQEAAYALVHAKNNGKFVVAALPDLPSERDYENATQDASSQFINTYTTKDRGYTMLTQPVSLQADVDEAEIKEKAEEDTIREGNVYLDNNDNLYTVSFVDNENVVFVDNQIKPITEVEKLVDTGVWKRQAGEREEKEIKKAEAELVRYKRLIKEFYSKLAATEELANEYKAKLTEIQKPETEELQKKIENIRPKLQEKMRYIHDLKVQTEEIESKTTQLQEKIDYATLTYKPSYTRTQAISLKAIQKLYPKYQKLFGKSKQAILDSFLEEITKEVTVTENLIVNIDSVDPLARQDIEKNKEQLRKQIKTSLYSNVNKKLAYKVLDDLLISNAIDFNTYNEFSDCVEKNSEISYNHLKNIQASINSTNGVRRISAGAWDKVKQTVGQMWDKFISWSSSFLNFVIMELQGAEELDNDLDVILSEQGE